MKTPLVHFRPSHPPLLRPSVRTPVLDLLGKWWWWGWGGVTLGRNGAGVWVHTVDVPVMSIQHDGAGVHKVDVPVMFILIDSAGVHKVDVPVMFIQLDRAGVWVHTVDVPVMFIQLDRVCNVDIGDWGGGGMQGLSSCVRPIGRQ